MDTSIFAIDRELSLRLMRMQAPDSRQDDVWQDVASDTGGQLLSSINQMGMRELKLGGGFRSLRIPIARLEDGACRWLDPRLAGILAHELGLDIQSEVAPICVLLSQFAQFLLLRGQSVPGEFGEVAYMSHTGELVLKVEIPAHQGEFKPLCQSI